MFLLAEYISKQQMMICWRWTNPPPSGVPHIWILLNICLLTELLVLTGPGNSKLWWQLRCACGQVLIVFLIYFFCLYCHCFTTSEDVMFYWYLKVAVIHLQAVWPQLKMNNSRRVTTRDQLMKCCGHSLCCHGDYVAEGVFTQRCLNRRWCLGKKIECLFDIDEDT